ncbi:hypothetical protein BDY19DRAFT_951532 [Irpex rosettiformis]|uniref:Uncharacterized protein n=1 Tax=Irpex rosettiformis TaxID=378272 RepID=A0ACB8U1D8_9APHY|nr:hypothetical protein BDY19DRAFT_951532 [Irpex rosettiformis]
MNVVWSDVKSFIPFIRCMPEGAFTVDREPSESRYRLATGYTLSFSRELEPSDWILFCKHTHRVRQFTDTQFLGAAYYPTSDTLETMSRFICQYREENSAGCLFPRLETLIAHTVKAEYGVPCYLPYICGPSLRNLELDMDLLFTQKNLNVAIYTNWSDIVPIMRSSWPGLHSMTLTGGEPSPSPYLHFVAGDWVNNLPHLRTFKASLALHSSLVYALCELPLLHTLELEGESCLPPPIDLHQLPPSVFRSLRSLTLPWKANNSPIPLLRVFWDTRTLKKLSITVNCDSNTTRGLRTLFDAISKISSVVSLYVDILYSIGRAEYEGAVSGQLLTILFPLRHMLGFAMRGYMNNFSLEDQDLREIASAWPELRTFRIDACPNINGVPPATTLLGVQALYNECPYLQHVQIIVNDDLPTKVIDDSGTRRRELDLPPAGPREYWMEELKVDVIRLTRNNYGWESMTYLPMAVRLMFPDLIYCNMATPHPSQTLGYSRNEARKTWNEVQCMELSEVRERLSNHVRSRTWYW